MLIAPSDHFQITSEALVHKLTINKATLDDEAEFSALAGPAKSTAALLVDGEC